MIGRKEQLKVVLGILISAVGLGIVTNLVSNQVETPIESFFKQWFPGFQYAYLAFLLFSLLFLIGLVLLTDKKSDTEKTSSATPADADRQHLLRSLQKRYEARLKKKMDTELGLTIQLKLSYTREGTSESFIGEYFGDKYKEKSAGSFDSLFEKYTSVLKRLLIVGEPGAGKTVLLLNFAQRLLDIARQDPLYPIPIILNLASWRDEGQPFERWLEQNLVHAVGQFGTSKEHAKELAASNNLLLLLDGVDEIPEAHRNSCLKSLFGYLQQTTKQRTRGLPEVILCCRREEYKQMEADAPVQAVVNIEPLALPAIRKELMAMKKRMGINGSPADKLLDSIEKHPHLVPWLDTAFGLHLALKLADGNFDFGTIQHREDLVRTYVGQQLESIRASYDPVKSRKWLAWLAGKLSVSRKGVTFELVDMQPDWAKKVWQYKLINGIGFGFICLIMFSAVGSIFAGMVAGFAAVIVVAITASEIKPEEIRVLSLKVFSTKKLLHSVAITLLILPVVIIAVGVHVGFIVLSICIPFIVATECLTTIKRIPTIYSPYKRFSSPLLFDLIRHSILVIVCLSIKSRLASSTFIIQLASVSLITTFLIILPLMVIGTSPLLSHFALRLVLFMEGAIPWRLVTFLDTVAAKTGLLEKDGGQWRFRHQLIQDVLKAGR